MKNKYIVIGVVILTIVFGIVGYMVGGNSSQPLGATANRLPHGYWDTADGYYVDGTAVINGSGQLSDGLTIAGAGATSSLVFSNYKTCIQVINSTGSTTAITFVGSGATTTTVTATLGSCN